MEKIMIIGAGFMGTGIAQVCAQANFQVILVDTREQALEKTQQTISHSLQKLFEKGHLAEHPPTILKRIQYRSHHEPASDMQWIIESIKTAALCNLWGKGMKSYIPVKGFSAQTCNIPSLNPSVMGSSVCRYKSTSIS